MAFDETCPVCLTADVVCGKWTLLLVRDLAAGTSRFCELERSLAGISPRTLSLRLRALEEEGMVERQADPEDARAALITSTAKGREALRGVREERTAFLVDRLHALSEADRHRLPALVGLLEDLAAPPEG